MKFLGRNYPRRKRSHTAWGTVRSLAEKHPKEEIDDPRLVPGMILSFSFWGFFFEFYYYLFYLFIFGCVGSLLLRAGFL